MKYTIKTTKCGQLSKYDFREERKKRNGLKIYPAIDNNCLKAASYDLTPTIIAMSAKVGMLGKL